MSEFTPGPWKFEDISTPKADDGLGYVYGPRSLVYPIAHTGSTEFSPEQNRADAELIASAPRLKEERDELLEGVKSLKGYLGQILVVLSEESRRNVALESYVAGAGNVAHNIIAKVEKPSG